MSDDDRASDFCADRLGSPVTDVLFRATSGGAVLGLQLADGRRVVLKAHQPRESPETLAAVQSIQGMLFRAGVPCPEPLAGPHPFADGFATAERFLDTGEFRDMHNPALRRLIAEALAWHLELTRACGSPAALADGWSLYVPGRLWPREAHAPGLDLRAPGAEWIDAIAARAKPLASAPGDPFVGHHDWSGKHFRFADGRVTAVYDWDSLRLGRESVIVGNAAMTFTANFDMPGLKQAPTPDDVAPSWTTTAPPAQRR